MKRFLAILLCVLYTTVSVGGAVYLHNCCGGTSISLYEKKELDACSFCAGMQSGEGDSDDHKTCMEGKCGHIEVKVDRLEDQLLGSQSSTNVVFSPGVLTRLWVILKPIFSEAPKDIIPDASRFAYKDSSPATYLLNCIFRI